jgi:KaiC/GvpD/RAD55 family RecA-like ATPase
MDRVSHIKRGTEDQTTTIHFVSGAGNVVYVTVREAPEQIFRIIVIPSWRRLTEQDGSLVHVNMDHVSHIKRGTEDQTTTIHFVNGAGNVVYVTVRETPEQIFRIIVKDNG